MGMKPEKPTYLTGRYRGVYRVTGRRGVSYGIDVTDAEGRRVRHIVKGGDLQAALLELRAVLGRKAEGRSTGLYTASKRLTFGQFVRDSYEPEILQAIENRSSRITTIAGLRSLLAFFAHIPLRRITTTEVDRYALLRRQNQITVPTFRYRCRILKDGREVWQTAARSKRAQLSPNTVRRELGALGSVLAHAVRRGVLAREALPEFPRLEATRREPQVAREQLRKLLKVADPRLRPIIGMGLATGRRRMELLGLTPGGVDWEARIMTFPRLKSRRKTIQVPMNRTAHAVLAELPRPLADDQPYFPLTPRALQRLWGRAVQAAGIPDLHLHDLRHVVGSHLLNKGVPDQMRAEVLGHSAGRQFAMTAGYSHATMEYLRRVYEELDDLVPQLWERSRLTKGSPSVQA